MFKLSDFLEKFKSIQPISKDLKDISDIIKKHTGIDVPIEKISLQKTKIHLDIEQIKKSVIFRKEQQIKDEIQTVLNIKIDRIF